MQGDAYLCKTATSAIRQMRSAGVPCQIGQSVASRSGPFTFPCQPSGPKRLGWRVSDQPGGHGTLHQQARRHEHPSEASPRASNDRAESTGKKPPRSPSWADLDHNPHLDRLPLNQARPGQSHLGGPTYLARDSGAAGQQSRAWRADRRDGTEHPFSRALDDYLGCPPGRPERRFACVRLCTHRDAFVFWGFPPARLASGRPGGPAWLASSYRAAPAT